LSLSALLLLLLAGSGQAQSAGPSRAASFERWRPEAARRPAPSLSLSPSPRRSYKTEGVWIGFATGLIAVPFAITSCNHRSNGCSGQTKAVYAVGLPVLGGALGWLIGGRFAKGE
jgi:hypothetical protein